MTYRQYGNMQWMAETDKWKVASHLRNTDSVLILLTFIFRRLLLFYYKLIQAVFLMKMPKIISW